MKRGCGATVLIGTRLKHLGSLFFAVSTNVAVLNANKTREVQSEGKNKRITDEFPQAPCKFLSWLIPK